MQIGSHDGRTNDPISTHIDENPQWRGVMVEPVPELFAKLRELRGDDDRIRLVNAAVCDAPGTVTLYTIEPEPGMPRWADQISRLHLDVLLKSETEIPGLRDRMHALEVPAVTSSVRAATTSLPFGARARNDSRPAIGPVRGL